MPAIEFSRIHSYTPAADGIPVPVILTGDREQVKLLAYVDTGAANCLFERRHGELLGLDVEAGERKGFGLLPGESRPTAI